MQLLSPYYYRKIIIYTKITNNCKIIFKRIRLHRLFGIIILYVVIGFKVDCNNSYLAR